jgi:uncharacterized protein YkwD
MKRWTWTMALGLVTLALLGAAPVTPRPQADRPDWDLGGLIPPVSVEGTGSQPNYTGCGGVLAPVVNAAYEQEVVERVNDVRAANGLPPLKRTGTLDDAARYHATDMGQDNYFDHDSYDRSGANLVMVCAWLARISSYYANWSWLAENIAAGYGTPASVMDGWMNSPGHRANILSSDTWEIGVGYYEGSGDYYRYWVQDFGRHNGVYPLIIDRDAETTDSRDVALYIYGDWQEVRLRNDDGAWSIWQPFQATMDWTLNSGRGEHTVWAEMRDGSRTASSSDTIYLLSSPPTLGGLPGTLRFSYNMASGQLRPPAWQVTPANVGDDAPLDWTVTTEGNWFQAAPLSGTTPGSFWITPDGFDTSTVATYSGAVTVTVVDPPETEGSPQRIEVTLQVIDAPFAVYLPLAARNEAPGQR